MGDWVAGLSKTGNKVNSAPIEFLNRIMAEQKDEAIFQSLTAIIHSYQWCHTIIKQTLKIL